jgi:hypothetical protein
MKIVNAGVLREPGEFLFYRNLQDDGWSSFDPEMGKKGGQWETLKIPCITPHRLIAEYGRPCFMKVDIEGADFQVVDALTPAAAPDYISLELSSVDPIVEKLVDLGYSSFKFVEGDSFRPNPPIFTHQRGWRLLRKLGRISPPVRRAIGKLPEALRAKAEFNPPGKYSPDGYCFTKYSSGPFGEQAAGSWLDPRRALRFCDRLKEDFRRGNRLLWWDVHARHSSVQQPTFLQQPAQAISQPKAVLG